MIKIDGVKTAAKIMTALRVSDADEVASELRLLDDHLAEQVLDEILRFDQIARADNRSLQILVRESDSSVLMTALLGASKETRDFILSNMSSRARTRFVEEMAQIGPTRHSDIEDARKKISRLARELAEANKFNLPIDGYVK